MQESSNVTPNINDDFKPVSKVVKSFLQKSYEKVLLCDMFQLYYFFT